MTVFKQAHGLLLWSLEATWCVWHPKLWKTSRNIPLNLQKTAFLALCLRQPAKIRGSYPDFEREEYQSGFEVAEKRRTNTPLWHHEPRREISERLCSRGCLTKTIIIIDEVELISLMYGPHMSVQHKLQTFASMLSKASNHHLRLVVTFMKGKCRHGSYYTQRNLWSPFVKLEFDLSDEELTQDWACDEWNLKGLKMVTRTDLIMQNSEVSVKPCTHPGWLNKILVRSATSTSRVRWRVNHTKRLQARLLQIGAHSFPIIVGLAAPQQQPTWSLQGRTKNGNVSIHMRSRLCP